MKQFWILGDTQLIELKGEEIIDRQNGRKKKCIKVYKQAPEPSGYYYTGRYYDDYFKAISALLNRLTTRLKKQAEINRQGKENFNKIHKLINHWAKEGMRYSKEKDKNNGNRINTRTGCSTGRKTKKRASGDD
jgi:hypothetical protein